MFFLRLTFIISSNILTVRNSLSSAVIATVIVTTYVMAAVTFSCYTYINIIQSSFAPLEVFISSSVSVPYVMGLSITITLSLDCIGQQADYEACVPIKLFTSMHQCKGEKEVVERDSGEYGTYRKCSKGAGTGQLLPLSL